jgi:hypothetical protein
MPENEERVFDVTKPQNVAPSSVSRPIIAGHRPVMADPMIRPAERPQSANQAQSEGLTPPLQNDPPPPIGDISAINSEKPPTSPDTGIPIESASVPPLPLGHSKDTSSSRGNGAKWLLLAVFLGLVGLYLAIDSGLIKTSINMPIHVFKQDKAKDNGSSSAQPVTTATPPPASKNTIPTGFNQYKDSSLPFTFDYPTAWGLPTATTEPGYSIRGGANKADGTYAVTINFATNKDVQIVTTSGKYLPAARPNSYYDFGQWCIQSDGKIYKNILHSTNSNGVDTATIMTCDQGPLTTANKITTAIIVEPKATDAVGKPLGDLYTANLDSPVYPVLRVKDAAMTNGTSIKILLSTIH